MSNSINNQFCTIGIAHHIRHARLFIFHYAVKRSDQLGDCLL